MLPAWLSAILTNGAFWAAFILLVNTVLTYAVPNFPREIQTAINGVVIAILGALGINGVKAKVNADKLTRAINDAARREANARAPADASTLGPNAASVHIGGKVQDSNVGAGGRDIRQG